MFSSRIFRFPVEHIAFLQQTLSQALKILAVFQIGETDPSLSDCSLSSAQLQWVNR